MNECVPLEEWKHFLPLHHLLGCIKRWILFPFDPRSDCGSSLSLSLDPFLEKNGNNGVAKNRIFSAGGVHFETVKSNNSRNGMWGFHLAAAGSLVTADDDAASVCDLMGGMRGWKRTFGLLVAFCLAEWLCFRSFSKSVEERSLFFSPFMRRL